MYVCVCACVCVWFVCACVIVYPMEGNTIWQDIYESQYAP